jgi:hypothetical protein
MYRRNPGGSWTFCRRVFRRFPLGRNRLFRFVFLEGLGMRRAVQEMKLVTVLDQRDGEMAVSARVAVFVPFGGGTGTGKGRRL